MARTITLRFDGEVFRPTEPVALPIDTECSVLINEAEPDSVLAAEDEVPSEDVSDAPEDEFPLLRYLKLARPLGVSDLAEQHDHYARGTPKR